MLLRVLTLVGLILAPGRAQQTCPVHPITANGNFTETRFFAAPITRVREAVADSMQAIGVSLFENSERILSGERRSPLVRDMRLPPGSEAVAAYLEPARNDGAEGTMLRVVTRRPGGGNDDPKRSWSATVIEETGCLLGLLSVADPMQDRVNRAQRAQGPPAREVVLPTGTPVLLRMRRFMHVASIMQGKRVTLEVANDVVTGGDIVIPRGALALAKFSSVQDIDRMGQGAKAVLEFEAVYSVSGGKIPVRATESFQGGDIEAKRMSFAPFAYFDPTGRQFYSYLQGKGFAIRAGTPFPVATEGNHRIPIYSAPTP